MELDKSILIIGQISSGKSTLAERLVANLAWKKVSFGGYLLDHCKRTEVTDQSRENLQAIGQQFIDDDPGKFLQAVIDFSASGHRELIFEGVRHLAIFEAIRQMTRNFTAVYVQATDGQRLSRYLVREKAIDLQKTEAEFAKANAHPVEQEVPQLRQYCDKVIVSSDDPELDYAALKSFLSVR